MAGQEHFRRAEELAAEAYKLLDQETARLPRAVGLPFTQTHPVLALAAATSVSTSNLNSRAWADIAGTRLESSS
jgi:hypothetical protein